MRNSSTITGAAVIVESRKAYADWRPNRYRIDSLFRIGYQPRHQMVIIDGQNLPGLRHIVSSLTAPRASGEPSGRARQ